MPCKELAHQQGVDLLARAGHKPIEQSRKTKENKHQGYAIDDELAHQSEEFAAMQQPDRAKERHLAVEIIGTL